MALLEKFLSFLLGLNKKSFTFKGNLTLYYFNSCPFCLKVRLALKELEMRVELKDIHAKKENLNELLKGGGKTTVPCLRIINGFKEEFLYESNDIIKYLKALK